MNMYSGQHQPNLWHRKKRVQWLEGLLAVMGLEVTTRGIDQDWYKYGEMEGESSVSFSTSWSCFVSSFVSFVNFFCFFILSGHCHTSCGH